MLCVGLGFFNSEQSVGAVVVMTAAVALTGCTYGAGVMVNHADISPQFCAFLFGISNTVAAICAFFATMIIAELTQNVSTVIKSPEQASFTGALA